MNKLEQKIYSLQRDFKCLAREVCSLSEGGNTETDPIFTASPAFGISSGDIGNWNDAVSLSHEHANMATLSGISSTNVTNWNNAYTATQNLSSNYFPLQGGTLTGSGGNGFVGFPNQSSTPLNPADGFKLYANAGNNPTFQKFNGVLTELSFVNTANRTYTFPDVTGEVVLTTGTQTITGDKTFTGALTIPATVITGNLSVSTNNNRNIGSSTNKFLNIYSAAFLGTGATVFGTEGTNSVLFRQGSGANYTGGFHTNTGNFFAQNIGGVLPTDNLAGVQFLHSKTASSAIARGVYITNTLTAAANNDVLVSLDIAPTFTNGAFTGVTNYAIRTVGGGMLLGGDMIPDGDNTRSIGSTTLRYGSIYTINVSKGNAGNSFNLTTTGSTGIFFRVQQTSNNIFIQAAGSAPTENNYKLTVDGTGASTGALFITGGISTFAGNILANANGTLDIGSTSNKFNNVYTNAVRGNGTLRLTAGTTNSIVFSQTTDANTIGQFFATTGNFRLQAPAALPTDSGERLQVDGTSLLNGIVTYGGGLRFKTDTSAAGTLVLTTAMTVVTNTGAASTWTLPTLTGNSGLLYILMNRGSGNITLNSNAGGNDIVANGTASNTATILPNEIIRIVHNGTSYMIL